MHQFGSVLLVSLSFALAVAMALIALPCPIVLAIGR
jgi:hypothetical protein